VLKQLKPEVLAASFDIPSEHIKRCIESQTEAVILPGRAIEPESEIEPEAERTHQEEEEEERRSIS
jgi:hypothetical protein